MTLVKNCTYAETFALDPGLGSAYPFPSFIRVSKLGNRHQAANFPARERGPMARIQGVSKEQASADARAIFEQQEKRYGSILNTAPVYALRPSIQKGVQALAEGIQLSGLIEAGLRHLVCMKTASINGCPY
jgi:hypothetical protein